MFKRTRQEKPFRGLLLIALAAAGCACWLFGSVPYLRAAPAPQKIRVQLSWKHQFQFAAFYAALAKGYYRDAGLDVQLIEGGPGIDSAQRVINGAADYGIYSSALILKRAQGAPVIALAALRQQSPTGLLARRVGDIQSVLDLADKTIAVSDNTRDEIEAFLLAVGIGKDRVTVVPKTKLGIDNLADAAAVSIYVSNEAFLTAGREQEYLYFKPQTAGIDFYGDVLFTTEAKVAESAAQVQAFRYATLQGLRYALAHPEELSDLIVERYNTQKKTREHLLFEARSTYALTRPDIVEPGYMSAGRWEHVSRVYQSLGKLKTIPEISAFLYKPHPSADPSYLWWILGGLAAAFVVVSPYLWKARNYPRQLITEMKQRERAETWFRSVIEAAPNGIVITDKDGVIVFASARVETLFGRTERDWIGRQFEIMLPERLRARYAELLADLGSDCRQHSGAERSFSGLRADGREFPIEIRWVPMEFMDAPHTLISIMDITEREEAEKSRRESESRYRMLVESTSDGIVTLTPAGIFLSGNSAALRLFGCEDESQLAGLSLSNVLAPTPSSGTSSQKRIQAAIRDAMANGSVSLDWNCRSLTGNTFEAGIAISKCETSGATVLLASVRDITAKKAQHLAEASIRAKAEFLAHVSHELRTPMNGILGMTELVLRTPLQDKQRHFLQTVQNSGRMLLRTINEILDFSKIEAGGLTLEKIDFDLADLCDEIIGLLAEGAHKKGLEVLCWLHPDVPSRLRGDPLRLRQVLTNLLGNAIKFTQHGEVLLTCTLLGSALDDALLRFEVKDSGIGIPKDRQAQIFESFSQADDSTTRQFGGTGLGLAISKRLAELMGGEIGVASEPGNGSTFWFTALLEKHPLQPDSLPPLPHRRALIAAHNLTLRQMLQTRLQHWGLSADTAADGHLALSLLRQNSYDLALLDLGTPGLDGLQLGRIILDDPNLGSLRPILLVPLGTDPAGAALPDSLPHLTKPLRVLELFNALCRIVEGRELAPDFAAPIPGTSHLPRFDAAVLVAEDNPVNQELASSMLEILGCKTDIAADGREALDRFSDKHFDLILMDCQMPVLDGYDTTRLIRHTEQLDQPLGDRGHTGSSHIPIIALTANALEGDREVCLAAGMDDFLCKPFTLDQLHDILARWLPASTALAQTQTAPISSTPPQPENAKIIDPAALDNIRALQQPGAPDLVRNIVEKFIASSSLLLQSLARAADSLDADALVKAAHSLKSSSANVGATRLAAECRNLESLARQNTLPPHLPQIINTINAEFLAASNALKEQLENSRGSAAPAPGAGR